MLGAAKWKRQTAHVVAQLSPDLSSKLVRSLRDTTVRLCSVFRIP